ncbi:hypothetical protein EV686_102355 [Paracandidimonas soli]|uniref:DUF192 domain-containing protein n=2 Tax=Paracandidimonas soli TaxID=1917182 RepID=A0A4R3VD89_9BURK|nr:hypothetical protein EV686_102355 [Paracandidimonas soli]
MTRQIPFPKPGQKSPGFLLFLLLVFLFLSQADRAHARQAMLLPTASLTLKQREIRVEVAATDASRNQGLMFRTSLPPDHGMLFAFDTPSRTCFWMKNTLIPLSIAFIDGTGRIINILDMQPHSLDNHCPESAMRYALEMPKGWFRDAGIEAGDKVEGLPAAN